MATKRKTTTVTDQQANDDADQLTAAFASLAKAPERAAACYD